MGDNKKSDNLNAEHFDGEVDFPEGCLTITHTRYKRDPKFQTIVYDAYDNSCAMCGIQLELIEAAHIVPHSHVKLEKFRASDKGQMELYLRWLEKYEQREGENAPVGLILCSDKSDEHVELLLLKEDRIKVAKYYTQLPTMAVLKQKLHRAIQIARQKEAIKQRR